MRRSPGGAMVQPGATWRGATSPNGESRTAAPDSSETRHSPEQSQPASRRSPTPSGTLRRESASSVIGQAVPGGWSGPFRPAGQVGLLLGSQRIDPNAQALELEAGDRTVDLRWNPMDLSWQRLSFTGDVFTRQRLIGEGHVHDGSRVPLGRSQIHEPAFAEQIHPPAVAKGVLIDEVANTFPALRHRLDTRDS